MKKEERLQQQCDVCGRLLDKNISNFRKYSRKTNGLNFHTTYRVTVDADSVTNNAVCQPGVTTEISINQAYIGGDTANISINVII